MKTSEMFSLIKEDFVKHSKPTCRRGICWAAYRLWSAYCIESTQLAYFNNIIDQQLDGCYSLEGWLEKNHDISYENSNLTFDNFVEKMRVTRLAWLDSLIANFAAKGD